MESEVMFETYKSLIDRFHHRIPFGPFTNSVVVGGALYATLVGLAVILGEGSKVAADYATPLVIFGVAYALYMESRIMEEIRETARNLWSDLAYDSRKWLSLVVDLRIRLASGVLLVVFLSLLAVTTPVLDAGWYEALALRLYVFALTTVAAFIGGEAGPAVIAVVFSAYKMSNELSSRVEPFNFQHFLILKRLARWGLLLSVFGSILISVAIVWTFVAPFNRAIFDIPVISSPFLILGLLIMAYCFLTPFLAIHGVLKTTKQRKTFEVIQAFDEVYKRTSKALETKDPEETRKEVELLGKRLTNLKAMLDVLTLAPEWPWDINMLRTFIVSLAAASYTVLGPETSGLTRASEAGLRFIFA